jgi:hypothetical protein
MRAEYKPTADQRALVESAAAFGTVSDAASQALEPALNLPSWACLMTAF